MRRLAFDLRKFLSGLPERDLAPLAALFGAAMAILGFFKIGGEMMEGETHALDRALLYALRVPGHPDEPIGPAWVLQAAQDVTSLGSVTILLLVITASAVYLLLTRRCGDAVLLLGAVLGGLALSTILKAHYDRPRPDLVPAAVAHLNASFPSGHALLSAVTYLTLAALIARTQQSMRLKAYLFVLAASLAILIGVSRVYLGLHWPSDVLAGWCLGAGWAILCRLGADYAAYAIGR